MLQDLAIRESTSADKGAIEALYPCAFPDEDLLPLVRELLTEQAGVLSLAAIIATSLAGHVIFTRCGVSGSRDTVALLGPLAVAPAWQRRGIGTAIVRAGVQRLGIAGVTQVYVLGDPAYYRRLGFVAECDVAPPYPLPAQWRGAWQSMCLAVPLAIPRAVPLAIPRAVPRGGGAPLRAGTLAVPPPWRRPALWAP